MTQNTKLSHIDLVPHWLLSATFLVILIVYNIICHIWENEIRIILDESERILIRSLLYGITIILFPMVKLLRYALLRLNQTLPGNKSAGQRYLLTIAITLSLIETVGTFGFLMFILGDDFNTLYIFSLLATLGIFLHKPKLNEYLAISEALNLKHANDD